MLTPHQGFTYNKFDKPNDWPELISTFDYKIEDGKLLGANDNIALSGVDREYIVSNGVVTKNTVPVPEGLVIGNFTTPSNGMFDIVTQTFEPFEYYPIIKTDSNMLQVESVQYGEGIKPEAKLVGPIGYTVVGNPTISNGIANGFSENNYLKLTNSISTSNNTPFEVQIAFTPASGSQGLSTIYRADVFRFGYYSSMKASFRFGNIPSEGGYSIFGFDYTLSAGTKYIATATYNGSNVTIKLFNASFILLEEKVFQNKNLNISSSSIAYLGSTSSYGDVGSIDLNQTYIKVNNTLWFGKENWTPCIFDDNSIVEFTGHKSDYSSYNTYAFKPTIQNSGTYDVWIDNQKVYENVTSATQTDINWSNLALMTGYSVTTPEALKAHILKITPSNKENKFTAFRHVSSSYTPSSIESTGVLQMHFELDYELNLQYLTNSSNDTQSSKLQAVTAKTDNLQVSNINLGFRWALQLKRLPSIKSSQAISISQILQGDSNIKYVNINKGNIVWYAFDNANSLEKLDGEYSITGNTNLFANVRSLKQLPNITSITTNSLPTYITNASSLQPTDIDLSDKDDLTKLDIYGTSSYRIYGLKSLKVSNEAPFDGASPQINVSYTGLERNALVELFNSLPYNVGYTEVGTPNIVDGVASGFSASDYLQVSASGISNADITEIVWKCKLSQSALKQASNFVMYKYSGGNLQLSVYGGTTTFNSPNLWVPGPNSSYGFTGFTPTVGTWFWLKITYDGSTMKLYSSLDGITYTLRRTEENLTMTGTDGLFNIGYSYGDTNYFSGEIDLNESYIKVNGVTWFNGKAATTKTIDVTGDIGSTQAYTVVGSNLTIEDGIVSNFSESDFVKTINSIKSQDITELVFKYKLDSAGLKNNYNWLFYGPQSFQIGIYGNSNLSYFNKPYVYLPGYGASISFNDFNAVPNHWYWLKYTYDGKTVNLYYKTAENEPFVLCNTQIPSPTISSSEGIVNIGHRWQGDTGSFFSGSIDLKNSYIKVNNRMWFTGNQLSSDDIAIATNKGWTVTGAS